MKKPTKPAPFRVDLSNLDMAFILGALAETLEEKRQPYTGPDCRRLARLHSRLDAIFSGSRSGRDYAVRRDGAVVYARNPSHVLAPPEGFVKIGGSNG